MSSIRTDRARAALRDAGVAALMCGPGADLRYLTGYHALPLERMTLLVVTPDAEPFLVAPHLERPRAEAFTSGIELVTFGETDDPVALVSSRLGAVHAPIAVGDRLWAMFVLRLQAAFDRASFVPASTIMKVLRIRKDDAEIDALARSGAAADRVAALIAASSVAGKRERDVSRWISDALIAEGLEQVNFAIVAAGPNAASPHHEPGDRVIQAGDALVCDFGGTLDGYCSDITRTFHVGDPPHEFVQLFGVLHEAQEAGVNAVKPGVTAESVDAAAREVIAAAGYGEYFIHRTGHGIGLEEHEEPYIVAGNTEPLEPGMAFSVEPGIYIPGTFGARIEDIVVCTDGSGRRLNNASRDLKVIA
ncbi:MAG TPA: Xaa-Pro peptidase family protein [Actinomycetota bacterium]